MRKSDAFLLFLCAAALLLAGLALDARAREREAAGTLAPAALAVRAFRLTDLCLFTEASYTRNPSVADFHTAFQNHPLALEHFPSGSFVPPPGRVRDARD